MVLPGRRARIACLAVVYSLAVLLAPAAGAWSGGHVHLAGAPLDCPMHQPQSATGHGLIASSDSPLLRCGCTNDLPGLSLGTPGLPVLTVSTQPPTVVEQATRGADPPLLTRPPVPLAPPPRTTRS